MTTFLQNTCKHTPGLFVGDPHAHGSACVRAPLAAVDIVKDHDLWITHIQSNSSAQHLVWCWYSTRAAQCTLPEVLSYNDIKQRALVWLAIIKNGLEGWWSTLDNANANIFETWAVAVGEARFGRTTLLFEWIEREYYKAQPASMDLQVYWELALIALRETLHLETLQTNMWPHFLDTLSHATHFPENLPLRIIPDMVKNHTGPVPPEFWQWFNHPLFPQALPYEKHVKPGGWFILWHAWLPTHWRHEIAVKIVETIEDAIAEGASLKLPDDLRTIWQVGPSFSFPYNILLAKAMLTSPRQEVVNPWSLNITSHWLDDIEHFYPDAHFLRTFYANLDGLTVEDARAWLTQRAYPAISGIELPPVDFADNDD